MVAWGCFLICLGWVRQALTCLTFFGGYKQSNTDSHFFAIIITVLYRSQKQSPFLICQLIADNKFNKKMRAKSKQRPTQPTSLSSSYSKYKCQHKHKSILTKLNNDSGYPQAILTPEHSTPRENNFVQQNKQNLKNFFKERIPPENILLGKLMKLQREMIDPKKMFEMKQMQYELKNKTKINLQKEFQAELKGMQQSPFSKVNASFQINDKNRELKEKYGGRMNLSFYQDQNYRRGTHSHIGKRSKILKKQAYDKVFGPDISSLSRTAVFSKPVTEVASPPRAKSISLNPAPNAADHHNLRSLINKMSGYKNKLQDRNEEHGIAAYPQQQEYFQQKEYGSHLITMIRNMTNFYLGKNIKQGYQKIEQLQDLNKIYKDYYTSMTIHKNNRLNKRLQHVNQTIAVNPCHQPFPSVQFHSKSKQIGDDNQSIFSYAQMPAEEVEESVIFQGSVEEGPVHSVRNRFKLLKRTLVRWAALFYIYGIKRKDIFIAFRANKQPYQLQGSYVFFKCIKLGDLESVRNFISKNSNFIFQTQSFGRSPLSYACIHNQAQIAELILSEGVNSDKLCNNKKTSLFYALQGRNIDLIKMILKKGASPWSTPSNPYSSIIKTHPNHLQLSILFNNAKKVYLGMQIQPTIHQRKQFWKRHSKRITEHCRITYQHFLQ